MSKTWDEMVRVTKANCRGEVTTAVVDAVLRALIAAGLAIVPREATEDMQNAAGIVIDHPSVYMGGPSRNGKHRGTQAYEAALSAGEIAPKKDPSP